MECPKCIGMLQKTKVVERRASEKKERGGATATYELELDKCFVCGGVWFDKGELNKYLAEGITVVDSPALGEGRDQELDRKVGNCPRCRISMKKVPAPKDPAMTIDTCEKCYGIWLDSTEIDRLEGKSKKGFLGSFFKGFGRPRSS